MPTVQLEAMVLVPVDTYRPMSSGGDSLKFDSSLPVSPGGTTCPLPLLQSALRNDGASIPSAPSSAGSARQQPETGRPSPQAGKLARSGSRGSNWAATPTWFDEEEARLQKEKSTLMRVDDAVGRPRTGRPVASSPVRRASAASLATHAEIEAAMSVTAPAPFRRTMAAIAGGGFRGPQANTRQCMCEVLKARLARAQAELKELRSLRSPMVTQLFVTDVCDAQVQTDALPLAPQAPAPPRPRMCEVGTQSRSASHEVAVQISPPPTVRPQMASAGVQAVHWPCCSHSGTQTSAALATESGCQTEPVLATIPAPRKDVKDAGVQAAAPQVAKVEAFAQAAPPCRDGTMQAGCPFAALRSACSQTEPRPILVEVGVQSNPEPLPKVVARATSAAQTEAPARSTRAMQTEGSSTASVGVQVAPPRGVDKSTQQTDERAATRDAALVTLEERVKALSTESAHLGEAVRTSKEEVKAWKTLGQSNALGRLNITILCPRAECTVNGDRIAMDSWDPKRVRAEFEKEVLPRFSKLFVEEDSGAAEPKARSAAVERTMQEFAEVFRNRLTAMLAAPNAQSAVAAAGQSRKKAS